MTAESYIQTNIANTKKLISFLKTTQHNLLPQKTNECFCNAFKKINNRIIINFKHQKT